MQVNLYELAEKIEEIGGIEKVFSLIDDNNDLIDRNHDAWYRIHELTKEVELYKSLNRAMKLGEYECG